MTGRFIAVVGPSGVGKDSVMAGMAARTGQLKLVRRVITRPSDAGGEDFEGVSEAEFLKRRDAGGFALWWQAHGLYYGIPVSVDAALASGQDLLANLSRSVLVAAAERFSDFHVLSLTADPQILGARLMARGREDAAEVARRLERAVCLPEDVAPITLDNSGPLGDTVTEALQSLYPVSA